MWAGQLGLRLCSVVWLCPLLCTARLFVRACRVSSEKKEMAKISITSLSELAILQSRGRLPRAAASLLLRRLLLLTLAEAQRPCRDFRTRRDRTQRAARPSVRVTSSFTLIICCGLPQVECP